MHPGPRAPLTPCPIEVVFRITVASRSQTLVPPASLESKADAHEQPVAVRAAGPGSSYAEVISRDPPLSVFPAHRRGHRRTRSSLEPSSSLAHRRARVQQLTRYGVEVQRLSLHIETTEGKESREILYAPLHVETTKEGGPLEVLHASPHEILKEGGYVLTMRVSCRTRALLCASEDEGSGLFRVLRCPLLCAETIEGGARARSRPLPSPRAKRG